MMKTLVIVCIAIDIALVGVSNTAAQRSETCPGGIQYITQPPTELNCNPVGQSLTLQCVIQQKKGYGIVTWYWTRCVDNAGVNGTAILPEDKNDVYGTYLLYSLGDNVTRSVLNFLVTDTTLGYYWCEINSASSRPSVITPVLPAANESLPDCPVGLIHNNVEECAIEGSPITIPRIPLPSFCPKTVDGTASTPGTLTTVISLLAVFGALVVLLVLVIVVLSVCLCCKIKQSRRAIAKEESPVEMQDTEELI